MTHIYHRCVAPGAFYLLILFIRQMKTAKIQVPHLKEGGFFQTVDEFIDFSCGNHAIKKILVANNGIGATKAIRSIRRWAFETFGNERMVR